MRVASILGLFLAGVVFLAVVVTMDTNRTALLGFTSGAATTWANLGLWLLAVVGIVGISTGLLVAAVSAFKGR